MMFAHTVLPSRKTFLAEGLGRMGYRNNPVIYLLFVRLPSVDSFLIFDKPLEAAPGGRWVIHCIQDEFITYSSPHLLFLLKEPEHHSAAKSASFPRFTPDLSGCQFEPYGVKTVNTQCAHFMG